jgi:hypothetical protein
VAAISVDNTITSSSVYARGRLLERVFHMFQEGELFEILRNNFDYFDLQWSLADCKIEIGFNLDNQLNSTYGNYELSVHLGA